MNICTKGHEMPWTLDKFCEDCGAPRDGEPIDLWVDCKCGERVLGFQQYCTCCGLKKGDQGSAIWEAGSASTTPKQANLTRRERIKKFIGI